MQALVDKIFENKSVIFIAATIVLLLALALVVFVVRSAYGRRVKTPGGGRTRLPRLGVVDAFDLDRQRQLVIIRRDNVEHLLMIGGPNDLVIESEIIRAEGREPRPREKDLREPKEALLAQPAGQGAGGGPLPGPPPWQQPELEPLAARTTAREPATRRAPVQPAASIPAGVAAPLPSAPEREAVAPALSAEQSALAPTPGATASPPAPPPASPPRSPAFPLPPRRAVPPLTPPQRATRESFLRPDAAARAEGASTPAGAFPRAPLATPFVRPSPPRQLAETIAKSASASASPAQPAGETPSESATSAAEIEPAPVQAPVTEKSEPLAEPDAANAQDELVIVAVESVEVEAPREGVERPEAAPERPAERSVFDSIDSLEEEMAKLLGRGPGR